MDKKNKAIETLRNALNESKPEKKRITLNEMIYNDAYEDYDEEPQFNDSEELEDRIMSQESEQVTPIEKNVPLTVDEDPEIMDMLAEIRIAVINGLAKLAKKPNSNYYDVLKKVLQAIDKPIEGANREK